jgi:hypothetical protein
MTGRAPSHPESLPAVVCVCARTRLVLLLLCTTHQAHVFTALQQPTYAHVLVPIQWLCHAATLASLRPVFPVPVAPVLPALVRLMPSVMVCAVVSIAALITSCMLGTVETAHKLAVCISTRARLQHDAHH